MDDLARIPLATGVELEVWDSGPRDAEALIFLHGFPENHRTWRHQVEHFNDRYRCIAPNQRGYADSSRPADASEYEANKLTGDIFALAAALDIQQFTIVGHDWGGAIAWVIAMFGQEQGVVTRAIIANAPHPAVFQRLLLTDPDQRSASQYMRAFRDPANDALVREHGLGGLLMKEVRWEGKAQNDPAETAVLLEQWSDPERAFAMLNWYRASQVHVPAPDDPLGVPDSHQFPDLPVIEVPTLVMWGMDDPALRPGNVDGLDEHVADLTVERIEDCGHFTPWEAPDAVNAAIGRFLSA